MTPDQARKLLGGYATGSLTEAETKALFQAALEDQDLFDELAGEQVMKEVLDEPGARQRLLAALEPSPQPAFWWAMRPWPWAAAAATLAIAVGLVVFTRTPRQPEPQQIAQVLKSPELPAAVQPPAPPPVKRKILATPRPEPAAEPSPELRQEALADKVQEAKPPEREAARGFGAAAPMAATGQRAENLVARQASGFAFNYAIRADGFLQIVPTASGFLAVTANDAVLFPSGAVGPGTPVRIQIPADATSLIIAFSATPEITRTPVHRDELSGTVTDQDPPNGRIVIQLSLTPATR